MADRLYLFAGAALALGLASGVALDRLVWNPDTDAKAGGSKRATHASGGALFTGSAADGSAGAGFSGDAFSKTSADGSGVEARALAVADKESDEILDTLAGITGTKEREKFLKTLFARLALDEAPFAMELAKALTDPVEKMTALKSIAMELAFLPGKEGDASGLESAMLGATLALASTNPEAATQWAATQLEGRARGMALMSVSSRWASVDPQAALAWAAANETGGDGREREWMMGRMFNSAASTDPATAAAYLNTLGEGRGRRSAVDSIARSWFDQNPASAMTWMQGLTDDGEKQRAAASIASRWAESDPAKALAWTAQLPEANRQEAIASAVGSWAGKEGAAAYTDAMAAGSLKEQAVRQVARSWSRTNQEAASAWVAAFTDENLQKIATDAMNRSRGGPGGRPFGGN